MSQCGKQDSSDRENNKGWVSYSIVPKSGLTMGTTIPNIAYIYFDNNPAIVTNTSFVELKPLSLQPHSWNANIKVYPNPADQFVYIEDKLHTIRTISVKNIIGQTIWNQDITTTHDIHTLDMSSWNKGLYLIQCKNAVGQSHTFKVVKQ